MFSSSLSQQFSPSIQRSCTVRILRPIWTCMGVLDQLLLDSFLSSLYLLWSYLFKAHKQNLIYTKYITCLLILKECLKIFLQTKIKQLWFTWFGVSFKFPLAVLLKGNISFCCWFTRCLNGSTNAGYLQQYCNWVLLCQVWIPLSIELHTF